MVQKHKHIISFLLLCSSLFSLAMDNEQRKAQSTENRSFKSLNMRSPEEQEALLTKMYETFTNRTQNNTTQSDEILKHAINFDQECIEELEQVYESAPKRARLIVKHLKNKNFYRNGSYRSSFFVGVPGSGKSTLAKAIAYKMQQKARWGNQFISSVAFLKQYRNQTAIYLNEILDKITTLSTPHLLIIDELNQILDHSGSEHHDTDGTSKSLWTFLDKQNNQHNFFFIGIMNSAEKLPLPFKNRMRGKIIFFDYITDQNMKIKIFKNKLFTQNMQFHPSIDDTYIAEQLNKLSTCCGRDINNLIITLTTIYREESSKTESMIFEKKHIEAAIKDSISECKKIKYYNIDETPEEKQERHHIENKQMHKKQFKKQMAEQRKMHEENKNMQQINFIQQQETQLKLHKEQMTEQKNMHLSNIKIQQTHFIQQQKIQLDLAKRQYSASIGIPYIGSINVSNLTQNGNNVIDSIITEEEQKLHKMDIKNDKQDKIDMQNDKQVSLENNHFCPCGCDYDTYLLKKLITF